MTLASACKGELAVNRAFFGIDASVKTQGSSIPKRFTYKDLKIATNSFIDKIGEGGYGSVYKGELENGTLVAVKLLHEHKTKGHVHEFLNEVANTASANHVNIVRLIGFCYEGERQALVYEFMPNGSLDICLARANNGSQLGVHNMFKIALGVAKGLEYLHRGCNTRILHSDIKPQNILLDDKFFPKISDFGLAKSLPQGDSILMSGTHAGGTRGYIAPEAFFKQYGGITYKSDVYSYGMLVLQMAGYQGRDREYKPEGVGSEEIQLQKKIITVGLWCISRNPVSRPTMCRVVEMLERTSELEAPPPDDDLSAILSASTSTSTSLSTLWSQNSNLQFTGKQLISLG